MVEKMNYVHTCLIILTCYSVLLFCVKTVSFNGPAGSSFTNLNFWDDADLVSFVDLNADRATDAVIYNKPKGLIQALVEVPSTFSHQSGGMTALDRQDLFNVDKNVKNVISADFNGDSMVDFLVVTSTDNILFHINVYLATDSKYMNASLHDIVLKGQPLVCDYNADMISDIYGMFQNGSRIVIYGGESFQRYIFDSPTLLISSFKYTAFTFVGTDTITSVVNLVEFKNGSLKIEIFHPFLDKNGSPSEPEYEYIDLPVELNKFSHLIFGDFSMNGSIQLLITGCSNVSCNMTWIYSFVDKNWLQAVTDWTPKGVSTSSDVYWELADVETTDLYIGDLIGPSLGDINLDGFPDLAVGLKYVKKSKTTHIMPAILLNTYALTGTVSFAAYLLPGLTDKLEHNLTQIAFFDQYENGVLDIFVSYKNESSMYSSLFIQQPTSEDYFLKVMLTNGLCNSASSCPSKRLPYGLPGYSYKASYITRGETGKSITSTGVFVSSSCCGALQLPFIIFGFGDFANYIEQVPVYIPSSSSVPRTREFTFIVPKSQIVVIPYPNNDPSKWQSKLFLEPLYDMKVIYIAITLIVTCFFLVITIAVLQYLEMKSDKQEKMQESQRFHFDAM